MIRVPEEIRKILDEVAALQVECMRITRTYVNKHGDENTIPDPRPDAAVKCAALRIQTLTTFHKLDLGMSANDNDSMADKSDEEIAEIIRKEVARLPRAERLALLADEPTQH